MRVLLLNKGSAKIVSWAILLFESGAAALVMLECCTIKFSRARMKLVV
jgi:hypothetical protein